MCLVACCFLVLLLPLAGGADSEDDAVPEVYRRLFKWIEMNGGNLDGVRVAHFGAHGWGIARAGSSPSPDGAPPSTVPGSFDYPVGLVLSTQIAMVEEGPVRTWLTHDSLQAMEESNFETSRVGCEDDGATDDDVCIQIDGCLVLSLFIAVERHEGATGLWHPYLDSMTAPNSPVYQLALLDLGVEDMDAEAATEANGLLPSSKDPVKAALELARLAKEIRSPFAPSRYATKHLDDALESARAQVDLLFAILKRGGGGGTQEDNALLEDELNLRRHVLWSYHVVKSRHIKTSLGCSMLPVWDLINHGWKTAHGSSIRSWQDMTEWIPENRNEKQNGRISYHNPHPDDNAEEDEEVLQDYGYKSRCPMDWLNLYGFIPQHLIEPIRRRTPSAGDAAVVPTTGGCGKVLINGREYSVYGDNGEGLYYHSESERVAPLLDAARAAWAADFHGGDDANQATTPEMRLVAALSARADELPPDRDLYAQLDSSPPSASTSAAVAVAKYQDAAAVMLLERQALLSTREALLRALERGA